MKDEAYIKSLVSTPVDRRKHPELYLCDMYNHIGSFVRSGSIDEHSLLKETIRMRRTSRDFVLENFEWLAARAKRWIQTHPGGDYPLGESRLI